MTSSEKHNWSRLNSAPTRQVCGAPGEQSRADLARPLQRFVRPAYS
jgi:hypothetical protein